MRIRIICSHEDSCRTNESESSRTWERTMVDQARRDKRMFLVRVWLNGVVVRAASAGILKQLFLLLQTHIPPHLLLTHDMRKQASFGPPCLSGTQVSPYLIDINVHVSFGGFRQLERRLGLRLKAPKVAGARQGRSRTLMSASASLIYMIHACSQVESSTSFFCVSHARSLSFE